MAAMALLDRDGIYGAPRFYLAAQKNGIRAHIGAEVTYAEGWRFPLLLTSRAGYQNLCRADHADEIARRKRAKGSSRKNWTAYANGLICLTGGDEGPLAHALRHGGIKARRNGAAAVRNFRPRKCLCRIAAALLPRRRGAAIRRRSRSRGNCVCLCLPPTASATRCRSNAKCWTFSPASAITAISNAGRLLTLNAERHLKSPVEMARIFADLPEAIANTESLSSRLQFTLNDLGYQFPKYPVPEWRNADGISSRAHARRDDSPLRREQ